MKYLIISWSVVTKDLIFLQAIRDLYIFVAGGSVTNAKVHQGFRNDEKVEEHCSTLSTSFTILEKTNTE